MLTEIHIEKCIQLEDSIRY